MINVGCSGWFYKHWKGTFYPDDIPQKAWFPYYANKFDTVELNNPFYGWPKENVLKQWYTKSPEEFMYTFKVNQSITHLKRFKETEELTRDFYKIAKTMKHKMGCFLFQLPPSFRYTADNLHNIITNLNPKHKNVIEFRHPTWWNDSVFDALATASATFVSVSAPGIPEEVVNTNGRIYLRLHGVHQWYRHNYSEAELQEYARRIEETNPREIWVYFDNDEQGHAPHNALRMKEILESQYSIGEQSKADATA